MQPELKKASLLLGFGIFAMCFFGMLFDLGTFVIAISHFLPGLAFSLLLIHYSEFNETIANKFFFIVLASMIYIICVIFVDLGSDARMVTSIKLFIASSLGAVLLKACYDHFFARNLSANQTVLMPLISGAVASIPSVISIYFFNNLGEEDTLIQTILYAGIFSIFPIWLYFFSILVIRTDHGE